MPAQLSCLTLSSADAATVDRMLDELVERYGRADEPSFVAEARSHAHELPPSLRQAVADVRDRERSDVLLISLRSLAEADAGPTPRHWRDVDPVRNVVAERHAFLLVLIASAFGDVFGWKTQQDGRLVHDILPIQGLEHEPVGASSVTELAWHTEDAFHPQRADYLGLSCIRNPTATSTTIATLDQEQLPPKTVEVLWEERFVIRPDLSHLPSHNSGEAERADSHTFDRIMEMLTRPKPIPVLFGAAEQPYLCIDPDYMEPLEGDAEAHAALQAAIALISEGMVDLALRAGEMAFIDNYRVVHGRRPFRPAYDGTDRWLKRISVTRDLRRSRALRDGISSRIIG